MNAFAPWVYAAARPDTFSLKHFVESDFFAGKRDEAFALAVFEYLCDPDTGIYHYCPVLDRFRRREVHDPLIILNAFGFCICHIHAHITAQIFKAAGYPARVACIDGHEGAEVLYDGNWHYFDTDLRAYSRRHPPAQHIIASREDCYRDPTIVSRQQNPSTPVYYVPDRPPERMAALFKSKPTYLKAFDDLTHSMDFVLRPGERIVRNLANEGKYLMTENYRTNWARYGNEPGPGGPKDRWNPKRTWSNGHWIYEPNLTGPFADLECGAADCSGFLQTDSGLEAPPGKTASVVFPFDLPYPICGIPDETGVYPPRGGALFTLETLRRNPSDRIAMRLSFDEGRNWREAWFSAAPVRATQIVDLTRRLHNRYRFLLKIDAVAAQSSGGDGEGPPRNPEDEPRHMGLYRFKADLSFMHAPWVFPTLEAGKLNNLRYHAFDRFRRPTRKFELLLETADSKAFQAALHAAENLAYDPADFSVTRPSDDSRDYALVFELKAPAAGAVSWLDAYALIEGHQPGETPITSMKIDVRDGTSGEWRCISEQETHPHPLRWHILHGAEARFSESHRSVFLRFRARKGIAAIRVCAHYVPSAATGNYRNPPVDITHRYREDGCEVRHVEHIPAGATDYRYAIQTGPKIENLGYDIGLPSVLKKTS